MAEKSPEGYLFLCPILDLQPSPGSFQWPECPAYWSLDPSGLERLSTEEASDLGFPSIEFTMWVHGCGCDESVYAGLRTFHKGKAFDPDTQDVARGLGYPLYQLSSELESPFAHGESQSVFLDQSRYSKVDCEDLTGERNYLAAHDEDSIIEPIGNESGKLVNNPFGFGCC
jgi:hypothetical protein